MYTGSYSKADLLLFLFVHLDDPLTIVSNCFSFRVQPSSDPPVRLINICLPEDNISLELIRIIFQISSNLQLFDIFLQSEITPCLEYLQGPGTRKFCHSI